MDKSKMGSCGWRDEGGREEEGSTGEDGKWKKRENKKQYIDALSFFLSDDDELG